MFIRGVPMTWVPSWTNSASENVRTDGVILGVDWISWTILALTVLVGALVSAAGAYALGLQWAARQGG